MKPHVAVLTSTSVVEGEVRREEVGAGNDEEGEQEGEVGREEFDAGGDEEWEVAPPL